MPSLTTRNLKGLEQPVFMHIMTDAAVLSDIAQMVYLILPKHQDLLLQITFILKPELVFLLMSGSDRKYSS